MATNGRKQLKIFCCTTQNHRELTDLNNDTFFMNTLNEFLFVNGTVHTNTSLFITYLCYFTWTEVCHSEGICFKWHFSGSSWLWIMSIPVYETVILPPPPCGFSIWFLKEEYRLKTLKGEFGPIRGYMLGGWGYIRRIKWKVDGQYNVGWR
jgi:hypothetical protein